MLYLGIDPGKDGALTVYNSDTKEHQCFAFKNLPVIDVLKQLNLKNIAMCTVEEPSYFSCGYNGHKISASSIASLAADYGYITGLLDAYNVPFCTISPYNWKKTYGLYGKKTKMCSVDKVKELYPDVNMYRTQNCKKEHDGIADSVLLAHFGICVDKFVKGNENVDGKSGN